MVPTLPATSGATSDCEDDIITYFVYVGYSFSLGRNDICFSIVAGDQYAVSSNLILAGYQFIKSCTWWQVLEIWYGDRYGYKFSKKHHKQV